MTHNVTLSNGTRILVDAPTKELARVGAVTAISHHPSILCKDHSCPLVGTERVRRITETQNPRSGLPRVIVTDNGTVFF